MTCEHALDALLDADLADVINGATSPLAVHVRGCSRCRRVADQLLNDTRLLATAAAATAPVRRSVTVRTVAFVPAAAAAALLVMVTMRQQSPGPVEQPVVTLPAPVVQPAPPAQPNAASSTAPRSVQERGVTAQRHALSPVTRLPSPVAPPRPLRAFPRAQPMVAAKRAAPVAIDLPIVSSAVTVTPPAGTSALVMHTSDPKLVVVWLY